MKKYNHPILFYYADKNYKDEIIFRKKILEDYNKMFWSTPDEVNFSIERIIVIALSKNPSFKIILNLFIYFGEKNMIDSITNNKEFFTEENHKYIIENIDLCKEFSIKKGIL